MENLIPHICHWFTVDNLSFLKRGGRISATIAVGGASLHMKPILHVDNEGHLVNVARVRGRGAVIKALFEKLVSTAVDIEEQTVMISHGDCYDDASKLADMIRSACHPKEIIINTINLVIGAHAGPGTLALFFVGSER
ncbi:DegV domain-containing protein [bioreactor metagenome]|uniref:DegV domain-containing protein n=1 Tax=bioreactor metagenome TaxID=1076179 RepID=A0A645J0N2_9ZZZZ